MTIVYITCPGPVTNAGCLACGATLSSMGTGAMHMRVFDATVVGEQVYVATDQLYAVTNWQARAEKAEADLARMTIALDIARGECGPDGHAPWCRQWKSMVAERDEARAALEALQEAATAAIPGGMETYTRETPMWVSVLLHTLAATPATLAGQVRARVLREAADEIVKDAGTESEWESEYAEGQRMACTYAAARLRALADESERAK